MALRYFDQRSALHGCFTTAQCGAPAGGIIYWSVNDLRVDQQESSIILRTAHAGRAVTRELSSVNCRQSFSWLVVKNLDWKARRAVFEAKAGADILTDVRERLRVLLGL